MLTLKDGNLLIASIWNTKHGLELAIKALRVSIDKHYDEGHDLRLLFDDLESRIINLCIKREFDLLEELVNKYHKCAFTKTILNDSMNDIFRYPGYKL